MGGASIDVATKKTTRAAQSGSDYLGLYCNIRAQTRAEAKGAEMKIFDE